MNSLSLNNTSLDDLRRAVSFKSSRAHKASLGQYLTPQSIATFMASMFTNSQDADIYLLDAGAGIGTLSSAFAERWFRGELGSAALRATAFEIDENLIETLTATLSRFTVSSDFSFAVRTGDFIEQAVKAINGYGGNRGYTHAILNPPYKKLGSNTASRQLLRKAGIETVNLYSAFVSLALDLLRPMGQLVFITPRSFCNGPYYKPFRSHILQRASIEKIHLFGSREKAFKEDSVLQENVIFMLRRNGDQQSVVVSTSTDDSFSDYKEAEYPFDRIVSASDKDAVIHIPTKFEQPLLQRSINVRSTLEELGISVSTGPVVDFRVKSKLCQVPNQSAVPLLYPQHFEGMGICWPRLEGKKPNALAIDNKTERMLFPAGHYTLVRRFSSKEERKRITATHISPTDAPSDKFAFENHLNVFHAKKNGLPKELARGLTVFLNSTFIDEAFRLFNGHTQVNATDLRSMRYLTKESLIQLGKISQIKPLQTQEEIDNLVSEFL